MNPWERMKRDPQMAVNTSNALNQLLEQRQAQANAQREQADQMAELGVQTDISPLLALADQWTGGKTAQAYQRPETGQERLANVTKLRQLASATDEDVINAKLKQYLGNDKNDVAALGRALAGDRAEATRDEKLDKTVLNYTERLENNYLLKEMNKQGVALSQVEDLEGLSRGGNTTAFAGLGIKMAKAMGEVGVMTDTDVKKYVTSGQITQKAGDILSNWINGRPSEPTLNEIADITKAIKLGMASKVGPVVDRYARRLNKNLGIPLDEAYERLAYPKSLFNVSGEKKTAGKTISRADLQALMKRDNVTEEQATSKLKSLGYTIGR